MKLSKEQVEHIARLARLSLDDGEKDVLAEDLTLILDYVDSLQGVDVTNFEPISQISGLHDVFREDSPEECDCVSDLLDCFPERSGDLLSVPQVFS